MAEKRICQKCGEEGWSAYEKASCWKCGEVQEKTCDTCEAYILPIEQYLEKKPCRECIGHSKWRPVKL